MGTPLWARTNPMRNIKKNDHAVKTICNVTAIKVGAKCQRMMASQKVQILCCTAFFVTAE